MADTYVTTTDPVLDMFFRIGAIRGRSSTAVQLFAEAYRCYPELAVRCALWSRDVREGAGEREHFRQILRWLEENAPEVLPRLIPMVPKLGRWDDLLVFDNIARAAPMIASALDDGDGLCAKWMPRKGKVAMKLAGLMGYTPRNWRKMLVRLSNTVEQSMCARQWDDINFEHVPSVAAIRYRNAFNKHQGERYGEYLNQTVKGERKVNTGAITPVDVLAPLVQSLCVGCYTYGHGRTLSDMEVNQIIGQWSQMKNTLATSPGILPIVDSSGSMDKKISNSVRSIDVSVALGIYVAEKQDGPFSGLVMTFSADPEFINIRGEDLPSKVALVGNSNWGMNTNIERAFRCILDTAVANKVMAEEMPRMLLIISDMEFDSATRGPYGYEPGQRVTAMDMVRTEYANAGYEPPVVVFWNVDSRHANLPALDNERGVVLVSGYSPQILESVLTLDPKSVTPKAVMLRTLTKDRYDWNNTVALYA